MRKDRILHKTFYAQLFALVISSLAATIVMLPRLNKKKKEEADA